MEGVDRQEQARQQLHSTTVVSTNVTGNGQSTIQFIPPDFARHFQSQLTALAAGYYQKLHTDGFTQPYFAPSSAESISVVQQQRFAQQAALHQLTNNSTTKVQSHVPDLGGVFVDSGHREVSSTDAVWGRWRPINDPRGLSRHLERHAVLKDVLRVLAA